MVGFLLFLLFMVPSVWIVATSIRGIKLTRNAR